MQFDHFGMHPSVRDGVVRSEFLTSEYVYVMPQMHFELICICAHSYAVEDWPKHICVCARKKCIWGITYKRSDSLYGDRLRLMFSYVMRGKGRNTSSMKFMESPQKEFKDRNFGRTA